MEISILYIIFLKQYIVFLLLVLLLFYLNFWHYQKKINFKEKENLEYIEIEKKKEIKYLKIKNIIFFIIGIIFLLFFWYYVSCFCAVYYNTQINLTKDILISFVTGMIYPCILTIIPAIIRIPALRKKSICLYRFSRILNFAISLI